MILTQLFESTLKDKADLDAKRKALQDIQNNPSTADDPQLKDELMWRKAQLEKEAQRKGLAENAEELNIGDDVVITGDVKHKGATGVIKDFGRDKRFVVVDLYNHGTHSFHSSDVSYNDYADSDEEEADMYDRDEDFRDYVSRNEVDEASDISGLLAASNLNRVFRVTANIDGATKKYRVKAQSERVALEKLKKQIPNAEVIHAEEITEFSEQGVAEASRDDAYTRDVKASQTGFNRPHDHRGLSQELAHETNNIQIAINGRPWKVIPGKGYADSREERAYLEGMKRWAEKKSAATGKKWTVYLTGASVTESLNELSPDTLVSYKKKAGADASAADRAGNYERGNKRFRGIVKATIKQGEQDAKKHRSRPPINENSSPVENAILHRIMVAHPDVLAKYGPAAVMMAANDTADFVGDVDEIGTSDVSSWVKQTIQILDSNHQLDEISKQTLGRYVKLAGADIADRASSSSFKSGAAGDKYNKADPSRHEINRERGIDRAIGKLTK